jgi:hypothetical protein
MYWILLEAVYSEEDKPFQERGPHRMFTFLPCIHLGMGRIVTMGRVHPYCKISPEESSC